MRKGWHWHWCKPLWDYKKKLRRGWRWDWYIRHWKVAPTALRRKAIQAVRLVGVFSCLLCVSMSDMLQRQTVEAYCKDAENGTIVGGWAVKFFVFSCFCVFVFLCFRVFGGCISFSLHARRDALAHPLYFFVQFPKKPIAAFFSIGADGRGFGHDILEPFTCVVA